MFTSKDLEKHIGVLPYDSELFGVYQSLLGWRSKRAEERFGQGLRLDKNGALGALMRSMTPQSSVRFTREGCGVELDVSPAVLAHGVRRQHDSHLMTLLAEELPPIGDYHDDQWHKYADEGRLTELLQDKVTEQLRAAFDKMCEAAPATRQVSQERSREAIRSALSTQLAYESAVAGSLIHLARVGEFTQLRTLFYGDRDHATALDRAMGVLDAKSAGAAYLDIESLDPRNRDHLAAVGLSPLSVVHLFRQYFFELDSFLGTPVEHVWLSPGAQVELIEISTRRRYVERVVEEATETTVRHELETQQEDELSDAVKEDNRQEISFGANGDANQSWIGGEANASTSFDMATTQEKAREVTHTRTRRQTQRLSTEIRKSYKSTFRTITETTDTSSKRYLLSNTTSELINYEMRRKMRQVGVQVQDVGTYLCWQTYVDDPGRQLGLGQLVHIGKEPDDGALKSPEEIPRLVSYPQKLQLSIPFQQTSEDEGDKDEGYRYGREVDEDTLEGDPETIAWRFQQEAVCDRTGYTLANVTFDTNGQSVEIDVSGLNIRYEDERWRYDVVLAFVNFKGQDAMTIGATLHWEPVAALNTDIDNANQAKRAQHEAAVQEAYEQEFISNARDRVKVASGIKQRPYDDLRTEERIVVYRALIQDMLTKGVPQPDDRTRHVVAELINAIFDVDKMLYFVSPEWWRPRLHRSRQELGAPKRPKVGQSSALVQSFAEASKLPVSLVSQLPGAAMSWAGLSTGKSRADTLLQGSSVGWGGVRESREDNYYITEASEPARLGASLGWLMQLDGDDLRNTFLNAPWVKAVLPIRPGMEEAALNWLTKVEGTHGIGEDDIYHSPPGTTELGSDGQPLDGRPMLEVLLDLARQVRDKHAKATTPDRFPKQDDSHGPASPPLVDAANTVTATPVDRVYEHGFYPLVGGFRNKAGEEDFAVVDQWVEVLPTDQIVPVPVQYDPKTGRML